MMQLRPYQEDDVDFYSSRNPVRVLNQNDTGLGKTVETIVSVMNHPRHQKVIVICGKSLLSKWRDEFLRWGWDGEVIIVSGDTKGGKKARYEQLDGFTGGLLVTNYHTIQDYLSTRMKLFHCDWCIVDEAHHIKNRKAGITKAIHQYIHAENRVALSATPTDGNPSDYWAILAFLFPNLYTSYWRFAEKYCNFIDNGYSQKAYVGPKNLNELKRELAPFTLSRLKRDVLDDLPPVTVEDVELSFDKTQLKHYHQIKVDSMTMGRAGLITVDSPLAKMTRLRQICSDPDVIGISAKSPKKDYILEVLEGATCPVIVYSSFEEVVSRLASTIPYPSVSITGSENTRARDRAVQAVNEGQVKVCYITEAGGEGLDLVGADRLVFYDLPLSQIRYRQVLGRLERIGQTNPVLVTRLRMAKSIEDRVLNLVTSKIEYSEQMLLKELIDNL